VGIRTGTKNLVPTGIRSPDLLVTSQYIFQLEIHSILRNYEEDDQNYL